MNRKILQEYANVLETIRRFISYCHLSLSYNLLLLLMEDYVNLTTTVMNVGKRVKQNVKSCKRIVIY